MIRINALRVVAFVTDIHAFWNLSHGFFIGKSRSDAGFTFVANFPVSLAI